MESEKRVHFSARQLNARGLILSPMIKAATFESTPDKPDHAPLVRKTSSLQLLCQDCGRANQCVSEPKQEHKVSACDLSRNVRPDTILQYQNKFSKEKESKLVSTLSVMSAVLSGNIDK